MIALEFPQKSRRDHRIAFRVVLLGLVGLVAVTAAGTPSARAGVEHSTFDQLLQHYVVDERYVDYAAWHASVVDQTALGDYVQRLEAVDTRTLSRDQALAFWINLYNATTLKLILDHYPVKSIKDLGNWLTSAWDKDLVRVNGRPFTLNQIENDVLRPTFPDPRIHFALNCASMSCPPLASHAYRAASIDAQLESVTRRAVADSYWVDTSGCGSHGRGTLRLSKIFEWYAKDFGGERGVRNFLAHYLPVQKPALQNGDCSIDYRDYDWSLNHPPTPAAER